MTTGEKMIRAWHWTQASKTLGYDDGRAVVAGQTLTHEGELILCRRGLHASKRLIDALSYAPGCYVWRVEVSGTIVHGDDKLVATERTALWGFDATKLVQDFARRCVLDVIHLWNPPDVVVKFLETDDPSLVTAAARAAARAAAARADAARAIVYAHAARAAAYAAYAVTEVTFAAGDAARAATSAAAATAARAYTAADAVAAYAAAADDARIKQNRRLTSMVVAEAQRLAMTQERR